MDRIRWQRVSSHSINFKSIDKEIVFLLWYAVFYIFAAYFLGLAILHYPIPILGAIQFIQDVWYTIVFKILLLLIVPSIVYFTLWGYKLEDLLLGIKSSARNISAAIVMVMIGFFLNATHLKGIQHNFYNFTNAPILLIVGTIMPLFQAAIPEEFYFRGFLQTRLEKKWNRISAILISSLLFTAWHLPSRYLLSNGVEGKAGDWAQIVLNTGLPVFIVGLIFAIHWSRYRNIVVLVLTHWAIDILPSVSSYFRIHY